MKADSKRLCPRCNSSEVFRSHRHGAMERYLLRAIGVRSAALIAMPDSIGSTTPTAPRRRISERPNEPVLQSLGKKSDHALCS
jgi:hypothetical protein